MEARNVTGKISIDQIPNLMRAIGFYPTEDEIINMVSEVRYQGKLLLIYICNFRVLSDLLLIYICKLHWNLHTMFACQVISFWFTHVISTS